MAIVRANGSSGLNKGADGSSGIERVAGERAVGKRSAKRSPKKSAAKKSVAKKRAAGRQEDPAASAEATEAQDRLDDQQPELGMAFHHLQRAGAVISLLEAESGGDLRALLEQGIDLYRHAISGKPAGSRKVRCAAGLLRAAEHLGMAGLYSARRKYRLEIEGSTLAAVLHHLDTLGARLDGVKRKKEGARLLAMARLLLARAEDSADDGHLRYELVMAADGICSALEAGL